MKYLITFLLIPAIWSCNTQRHTQSTEAKKVQSNVTVQDSLHHTLRDTAHKADELHNTVTAKDSSHTVTKRLKDSSSVTVTFNGGAIDKPIIVKDSAGQTVIDPGGRNVTGVKVDKSKTRYAKQSDKGSTANSVTDAKGDSSGVKTDNIAKSTSTAVNKTITDNKTTKMDEVSKVSFLAKFGLYFIILLVVVAAYFVIKYWSKIKSCLPW